MTQTATIVALGVLVIVAAAAAFLFGRSTGRSETLARQAAAKQTAEELSRRIVADAEREAEGLRKSAVLSGKEELMKAREGWESEARQRREEIDREERRVQEREVSLDRKLDALDQRDKELGRRATELGRKEKLVADRQGELDKMVGEERRRLEALAGMSAADARTELIQ